MSKIKKLSLTNFRLHEKLDLVFLKDIVIFIGDNASGKTSILEAIYYVSATKSNRTNKDLDLISTNKNYAKIELSTLDSNYLVVISEQGKKTFINRVEKNKLSEFIGNLHVVYYSIEDINLIKGSPQERRRFLNIELSKIDKAYISNLNRYNAILKERNELLKKIDFNSDLVLLNILNEQLANVAVPIIKQRKKFIDELNIYLEKTYKDLFNKETIKINYKPSISDNNYLETLKSKNTSDMFSRITNYGVHRDDFEFLKDDLELSVYSSQGEQKSVAIALKLALVEYVLEKCNKIPILLLDDLFSELDETRQNSIIKYLDKVQTFITTTDLNNIKNEMLLNAQILKLRK